MSKSPILTDTQFRRLAQYWYRAEMMHRLLHLLKDRSGPGLRKLAREEFWEFETYPQYWLSSLFFVVEGFNRLKIRDSRVQHLLNENIQLLKQNRHNTFHFVVSDEYPSGSPSLILDHSQLNWAEDLHEALRIDILETAEIRAKDEVAALSMVVKARRNRGRVPSKQ